MPFETLQPAGRRRGDLYRERPERSEVGPFDKLLCEPMESRVINCGGAGRAAFPPSVGFFGFGGAGVKYRGIAPEQLNTYLRHCSREVSAESPEKR